MAHLWRERNCCVREVGKIVRGVFGGHGPKASPVLFYRQNQQRFGLHAGKLPMGKSKNSSEQSSHKGANVNVSEAKIDGAIDAKIEELDIHAGGEGGTMTALPPRQDEVDSILA